MASEGGQTAFKNAGLETPDVVVIIVFIILCLMVGIWATWRTQRGSVSGYFLAGRDIMWFAIGASLFSSNIGSGSFIGLGGTGAASGIAVASYELNGLFCLLLLGWLFVPVYISSGVYTMPEYLMRRFGGQRLQLYMAVLSLIIYVFTKISADIYAGAIFIQQAVNWDMYASIVALLVVTAIYTVSGGLRAVIYTDTMQTVIMIIGAIILMGISFNEVGGIAALYEKYPQAIASTNLMGSSNSTNVTMNSCGIPTSDAFHLLRPADAGDLPWPGNVFGITILSSWYFCNDQVLVQRSLAAKNMYHVKGGSILAAYLKVLPLFTTVFPGMISRVLFPDEVACTDPDICESVCGNRAGCTNIAYPKLVIELLPTGLKGLMLAAMIAALMSSLTSNFNSSATIFTIDIWKRFRAKATEAEMLVVGRIFIVVLMGISVLWIPVLQASQGGQLFNYIQTVTGYFAPPILSLFLLAVLWERTNEQGAFWGLMIGLAVGITRMGLDFGYGTPGCGEEDPRPAIVSKVHFLHFTIILFVVSVIATMLISALTKPIPKKHTVRLTWWTRMSHSEREEYPEELVRQMKAEEKMKKEKKPARDPATLPGWRKILYLICGYEPPRDVEISQEEVDLFKKQMNNIEEKGFWKIFVNANAVVLMSFGVFLWVFFA
ncbi:sodium/glucose cotransporter 4 [Aplysia californica]|uniref:Sodium/glucose cotransporter 4 n=1 Tax=Aplysia californica TaxID=6500 RepID=A0ABM0ZVX3_APLCA|nr:sodium/glucose cotransporter 4 [Aplysia californica]